MKISFTAASYRKPMLSDHALNPLICALPEPIGAKRLNKLLTKKHTLTVVGVSNSDRIHEVKKLSNVVVPTKPFWEFYNLIYELIVDGYEKRNPLDVKVVAWSYDVADPDVSLEVLQGKNLITIEASEPTCEHSFLTGLSGMGKTKLKNAVMSVGFPNMITHHRDDFDEIQIVYLNVEMPSDGARGALLGNIIVAFDKTLRGVEKTDYLGSVKSKSGKLATIGVLEGVVKSLCLKYHVGVIIIDEFQHLNVVSQNNFDMMLQLFDAFSNELHLPIVKIGTSESLKPFQRRFRHSRRAGGPIELIPYQPVYNFTKSSSRSAASNEGKDWTRLVKTVFDYQVVKNPIPYSERYDKELYHLSCGIPYVLFRLWQKVQIDAIRSGHETINLNLLKNSYNNHFKLIKAALTSLRSNKSARFKDLFTISQLFDDGEVALALKHLDRLVTKEDFTGAAAVELIKAVDDVNLDSTLSASQSKKLEKIKKRLHENSQNVTAGQTIEIDNAKT